MMNEMQDEPAPAPRRTARRSGAIAAALAAGLVAGSLAGGAAGGVIGVALQDSQPAATVSESSGSTLSTASSTTSAAVDVSSVIEKVQDTVVTIEVATQGGGGLATTGSGSGFIVTSDGLILTSYHVIDSAAQITVVMTDGSSTTADVVATDTSRDVALIDIGGSGHPTVTLSSTSVQIGQTVIAIGTALGEYPNTVTLGVVSGLNREMTASTGFRQSETLTDVIQTDAAMSSGMSGGPLLDSAGQVVGINTAIYGDATGIAFAVPIADGIALLASTGRA